jgi:hypothetical protein
MIQRIESPFTRNIYDLTQPSVVKAINLFKTLDSTNDNDAFLSAIALAIHEMYIYNKTTDSYVQIETDEPTLLMDVVKEIPQLDISMLVNQIKDMYYITQFKLESTCTHCGTNMVNELSVDELVFLVAQDTFTEVR